MVTYYTAIALGFLCALIYSGLLIASTMGSSFMHSITARIMGSFIRIGIVVYALAYVLRFGSNHLILTVGVFFVSVWVMMVAYKYMRA